MFTARMADPEPKLHHAEPAGRETPPSPAADAGAAGQRKKRPWGAALAVLLALAVLAAVASRVGWSGIREWLLQLNEPATVAAMAVFPLFGFSIAAVYVIAGAKFGLWGGAAVIVGITAFHLLASHLISQSLLRDRLQRWLARHQTHFPAIPHGEEVSVSVMVALIPAVPYFAKNYLLALSGVPLRTYFSCCLPIYVLRSYVTLSLGDLSGDWSNRKLLLLGVVYLVKLGICVFLFERIRHRIKRAHVLQLRARAQPADDTSTMQRI
ncbi:hypothetical protein DB347_22205 [Opitutaceae bacterium EW11]|nr:hypothetical protein DB347_22205 [Opitutaceae bacterium EW11]